MRKEKEEHRNEKEEHLKEKEEHHKEKEKHIKEKEEHRKEKEEHRKEKAMRLRSQRIFEGCLNRANQVFLPSSLGQFFLDEERMIYLTAMPLVL